MTTNVNSVRKYRSSSVTSGIKAEGDDIEGADP